MLGRSEVGKEVAGNDKFGEVNCTAMRKAGNVATGRREAARRGGRPELMGRRPQFAIRLRYNTCVWRFDCNDGNESVTFKV